MTPGLLRRRRERYGEAKSANPECIMDRKNLRMLLGVILDLTIYLPLPNRTFSRRMASMSERLTKHIICHLIPNYNWRRFRVSNFKLLLLSSLPSAIDKFFCMELVLVPMTCWNSQNHGRILVISIDVSGAEIFSGQPFICE